MQTITEQEIFDTVYVGLLRQGEQSRVGTKCAYRGQGGTKCAVGMLITDEEYTLEMEACGVVCALVRLGLLPIRLLPHVRLLERLQEIHDYCNPGVWQTRLHDLACEYRLKVPEFTPCESPGTT